MERTAVVLVEKLSPKELREHGYSLKVWGKTSEWQIEREPEESVVENEVPHFPSWEEGCIIWGRSLNSPWWPGVVCAPSHGEITDIPGCAWVRWPHFTDLDVVCNANIIEFKEGYSRFFSDRCTQKLYRKGVIENIKILEVLADESVQEH